MNIGELSTASGVNSKLIRHYESIGVIPKARRSTSGYRIYSEIDVQFLRFVKRARNMGFSMKEIKSLVDLWRNKKRASKEVKELATKHLQRLEMKILEIQEMADSLRTLTRNCHGDNRPECPIIKSLEGENV